LTICVRINIRRRQGLVPPIQWSLTGILLLHYYRVFFNAWN